MNFTKKRWVILVACCLTNLCLGSLYAWSVFASGLAPYLSGLSGQEITTGDLAIVYTIANAVGPITMIIGGRFNDRIGPKKIILLSGILFGVGMITSSFATSIGMLIVTYGLLVGLGIGFGYGAAISVSVKFFPDKRGLIGGLTTAAYGLSSVLVPPIVTSIVEKSDVSAAFKWIGIIFMVIVIVCSFIVQKCPDGFVPDGWTPPAKTAGAAPVDMNWKQMLSTPIFYVMILLLLSGAFSGMMIISQASSVAQNMIGMTVAAAGAAVSILALFNSAGRIAAGYLSDKIGRIQTLTLSCVLSIIGLVCLFLCGTGTTVIFYVGIAIVGICFGSFMGVFPGFTADMFGAKNNSVNYGIMFIGFALAGFFGPMAMKSVYGATGAYQNSFLISIALSVVGIVLTIVYRIMNKKRSKQ